MNEFIRPLFFRMNSRALAQGQFSTIHEESGGILQRGAVSPILFL